MKIAQVVCVYPPYKGGIGNVAYNYADLLKKKGFEIKTFTVQYNNSQDSQNVKFLKPILKFGKGAFMPCLIKELKDFDLVILHYPFFGGAESVYLAKMFNKNLRIIIQYHMDVVFNSWFLKILSFPSLILEKYLFLKSEKIICASLNYVKNSQIKDFYQQYPNKFVEIPFGVDDKKFFPIKKEKRIKKKILFVAGLDKAHYFKGLSVLLKAFDNLDCKNYELIIVGDGDLRIDYENEAKKLKNKDRIFFKGKLNDNDLIKTYQDTDLFVLPSINKGEAFGLVLLEAMACGAPVIASKLAGVDSVFEDSKQGFYTEVYSVNDLSKRIKEILEDDNLRNLMSQEARKLIIEKYSWNNIINKIEKNLRKFEK